MLKLNKDSNPLDQISDLIKVLDSCLGQDYMIAGGFVRDWYQDEPFNDIDIYLFDESGHDLRKKLTSTGRFAINKTNGNFVDTIFQDKTYLPFTKGRPKYNVQFICWYAGIESALNSFDFEHCKFFIPMDLSELKLINWSVGIIPRTPYAYSNKAIKALKKKELQPSTKTLSTLQSVASNENGLVILERYIKRTRKFMARGFSVPEGLKALLLSSTELFLKTKVLDKKFSRRQSVFLEDADYDDNGYSKYSELYIARNLIKELILLYDEQERTIFLLSPAPIIRDVMKELIEKVS